MSHPRGEPTYPNWQKATMGTPVRHTQTGWTGTVVHVVTRLRGDGHISVLWDRSNAIGVVSAPAFDLQPT